MFVDAIYSNRQRVFSRANLVLCPPYLISQRHSIYSQMKFRLKFIVNIARDVQEFTVFLDLEAVLSTRDQSSPLDLVLCQVGNVLSNFDTVKNKRQFVDTTLPCGLKGYNRVWRVSLSYFVTLKFGAGGEAVCTRLEVLVIHVDGRLMNHDFKVEGAKLQRKYTTPHSS